MKHYKITYVNKASHLREIEVLANTPQQAMRDFIFSWELLGVSMVLSFDDENCSKIL